VFGPTLAGAQRSIPTERLRDLLPANYSVLGAAATPDTARSGAFRAGLAGKPLDASFGCFG